MVKKVRVSKAKRLLLKELHYWQEHYRKELWGLSLTRKKIEEIAKRLKKEK